MGKFVVTDRNEIIGNIASLFGSFDWFNIICPLMLRLTIPIVLQLTKGTYMNSWLVANAPFGQYLRFVKTTDHSKQNISLALTIFSESAEGTFKTVTNLCFCFSLLVWHQCHSISGHCMKKQ